MGAEESPGPIAGRIGSRRTECEKPAKSCDWNDQGDCTSNPPIALLGLMLGGPRHDRQEAGDAGNPSTDRLTRPLLFRITVLVKSCGACRRSGAEGL